jgi:hypothetical protein
MNPVTVSRVIMDDYVKAQHYDIRNLVLEFALLQFDGSLLELIWTIDDAHVLDSLREMCAKSSVTLWERALGIVVFTHLSEQANRGDFS